VSTQQVKKTSRGYRLSTPSVAVDTGDDPRRAMGLRLAWAQTAVERQRQQRPGHYGYSLFAVSREDLRRLHQVHLQYVRVMQEIIAGSTQSDCVGLYCAQLLDLSGEETP